MRNEGRTVEAFAQTTRNLANTSRAKKKKKREERKEDRRSLGAAPRFKSARRIDRIAKLIRGSLSGASQKASEDARKFLASLKTEDCDRIPVTYLATGHRCLPRAYSLTME